MATVGYARVSSQGQSLDVQEDQLRAAGCEKIFAEKASGTTTEKRPELAKALEWVREGDVFVVSRIDRLARSVTDLNGIIRRLRERGVHFRSIMQGEFDTSNSTSALFLSILGAVAEFETQLRAERQAEGIRRALETGQTKTGKKYGRPPVDHTPVLRLKAEGVPPAEIARRLKIARSTVYAALKAGRAEDGDG